MRRIYSIFTKFVSKCRQFSTVPKQSRSLKALRTSLQAFGKFVVWVHCSEMPLSRTSLLSSSLLLDVIPLAVGCLPAARAGRYDCTDCLSPERSFFPRNIFVFYVYFDTFMCMINYSTLDEKSRGQAVCNIHLAWLSLT